MNIIDKKLPVQEQLILGLLLTLIGGFYDAYTYVNCGGIFANAQTGNWVFIGLNIVDGNYIKVFHYFIPIIFFILGVITNKFIKHRYEKLSIYRYIYLLFFIEIVFLLTIYFCPKLFGIDLRPILISFICALQFDGFRRINRLAFASVFCTGNLRSMSEELFKFLAKKNIDNIKAVGIYCSVLSFFVLGVCIGAYISRKFLHSAILVPLFLVIVCIFLVGVIRKNLLKMT